MANKKSSLTEEQIELLNLPDPNYKAATAEIKFCLKNSSGKVVKRFEPVNLSNLTLDEKYLKVPVQDRRAGKPLQLNVTIPTDKSLESAGHRAILLTKLMERYDLASLAETTT